MTRPLEPGVFSQLFLRLAAEVEVRAAEALDAAAELVEERARQSVSARTHAYRTPTPAREGGPPAMISGTLAGQIGRTAPQIGAGTVSVRVGVKSGRTAPYSKTDASLVARYLEIEGAGRSRIKYPFLHAAFEHTAHPAALATFKAAFSRPWT